MKTEPLTLPQAKELLEIAMHQSIGYSLKYLDKERDMFQVQLFVKESRGIQIRFICPTDPIQFMGNVHYQLFTLGFLVGRQGN